MFNNTANDTNNNQKHFHAPAFPTDSLPIFIADYIKDNAEQMQWCSSDLIGISLIVVLASTIGKHVRVRPKQKDTNWSERSCLWAAIISEEGQMKIPALSIGTAPMRAIQEEYDIEHKVALAIWKEAEKVVKRREKAYEKECQIIMENNGSGAELPKRSDSLNLDDKPIEKRLLVSDTKVEKLAYLMVASPGLTLVKKDLSTFLLSMSRYRKDSDKQFYLECYRGYGYSHYVRQVKRRAQSINDLYLNIVGGIQSTAVKKLIRSSIAGLDDGFFERFGIMAYPEKTTWKNVNRHPNQDIDDKYEKICLNLFKTDWNEVLFYDLKKGYPYCKFSLDAQSIFIDWLSKHMNSRNDEKFKDDGFLAGLNSKKQGLLVKLSLIIHLTAWRAGEEADPKRISVLSLTRATNLVENYFVPMWERVYFTFGKKN